MPRVNRPKAYRVVVSDHAHQRYQERTGQAVKRRKLERFMTAKLNEALGIGLCLDWTGAAWIEVDPWLWANVRLDTFGWVVTTFIDYSQKKQAEAVG